MDSILGAEFCSSGTRSGNLWKEWALGKVLPWSERQGWGTEGTGQSMQGYWDGEGRERCGQEGKDRSHHPEGPSAKGILSSSAGTSMIKRFLLFSSLVSKLFCTVSCFKETHEYNHLQKTKETENNDRGLDWKLVPLFKSVGISFSRGFFTFLS